MARPSVDILFESAAETFREKLIGVILTGDNSDRAQGFAKIDQLRGLSIVQDPNTAECNSMPLEAIKKTLDLVKIFNTDKITNYTIKITQISKKA